MGEQRRCAISARIIGVMQKDESTKKVKFTTEEKVFNYVSDKSLMINQYDNLKRFLSTDVHDIHFVVGSE